MRSSAVWLLAVPALLPCAAAAQVALLAGEDLLARKAELAGKTWTPETKMLVMGACNPSTAKDLCELVVIGTVDATGSIVKIKGASAKQK